MSRIFSRSGLTSEADLLVRFSSKKVLKLLDLLRQARLDLCNVLCDTCGGLVGACRCPKARYSFGAGREVSILVFVQMRQTAMVRKGLKSTNYTY